MFLSSELKFFSFISGDLVNGRFSSLWPRLGHRVAQRLGLNISSCSNSPHKKYVDCWYLLICDTVFSRSQPDEPGALRSLSLLMILQ